MAKDQNRLQESNALWLALLVVLVIAVFHRLLFTDQIIRASDVITQFFWSAKDAHSHSFLDYIKALPDTFRVNWEPTDNGGRAGEGGGNALNLLFYRALILQYFPFPASIAWLAVLSLTWGGIGTFLYCRLIGVSRFGALAAGLLFALCTENASLINAGHIQKIETICWFPWILLFLEKALRSGRFYHYAVTSLLLAVQFFSMHWQIAFYSCLAVGFYWCFFMAVRFVNEDRRDLRRLGRNTVLATAMTVLFLTTAGIAFLPLVHWSQQSERGGAVLKGGSSGGGMAWDEGMSWSMPPEEIATFLIPGLVGYSRQEAGDRSDGGQVYYWGRMHFTQTNDYLGLLPILMIPLVFLRRRDRYTWFFGLFMAGTLLMALGKYTFVYRFMFEHLPGFATFRVPKMILFLFAFGGAVFLGRGLDLLAESGEERREFRPWLAGLFGLMLALTATALFVRFGDQAIANLTAGVIDQPTRYQQGMALIQERYQNIIRESWIAVLMAAGYLALLGLWFLRRLPTRYLLPLLLLLLLTDLWRVNRNFIVLCPPPESNRKQAKNDIVTFLEKNIGTYRMQTMDGNESFYYSDYGLPNISAYVTISERRYREFLDNFAFTGAMPDIMNMKYLVMPGAEFQQQQRSLAGKYRPVFFSTTGAVVLENLTVMPKAWLVTSVQVLPDPLQRVSLIGYAGFDPSREGIVESPPPIQLPGVARPLPAGAARVTSYERNRLTVETSTPVNTLLVVGEKYYESWVARVDGKRVPIEPVNHILRGVYLPAGSHRVEFVFESVPFRIGKYLTLGSLAIIAAVVGWELLRRRRA